MSNKQHLLNPSEENPSKTVDTKLSRISVEVTELGSSDTSRETCGKRALDSLVEGKPNDQVTSPSQTGCRPSSHVGTIGCAVATSLVFLVNLTVTIWAAAHYGIEDGLGTIHDGSCDNTKTMSLWTHFAINVLSTAILSASNYCMQCLSAPTRRDIDRAHARHVWLHVGVQNVRNLLYVSRIKAFLWLLLALSSIPLHLFYNSAIFSTLSAREYDILTISPNLAAGRYFNATAVPPDAIKPGPWNHTLSDEWAFPPYPHSRLVEFGQKLLTDFNNTSLWQRMEKKECIRKYGRQFISTQGDFLAVSHALNDSFSIKFIKTAYPKTANGGGPSYNWMCDLYPEAKHGTNNEQCRLDVLLSPPYAEKWAIRSNRLNDLGPKYIHYGWQGDPVDYCLSRRVEEHCRLQFSLALLAVVIISNFIKATCMILMVYRHDATPLITLGDAIASFLDDPDTTTQGNCIATKYTFQKRQWAQQPRPWASKKVIWFNNSSSARWAFYNILSILVLIVTALFLHPAVTNKRLADNSFKGLWELGYGTVTFQSLVADNAFPTNGGLLLPIFVANFPQILLSFLYLAYNDLFTSMLLCREWINYSKHRKPLRVTKPRGEQRSTYSLQLPYSYGIPLVIISGILHWLVSQSIFLARITVFDSLDRDDKRYSVSTCGYSCIAIIAVIFVSSIALLAGNSIGFRKYPSGMPMAGSNSAAISAACHAPPEDVDASVLPVMWGVVSMEDNTGHCCFTSLDVTPPIVGECYAGLDASRGKG
ncbi:MAG: hypothetical protein Q9226_007434 [Calogaya cf. arnoldii]